MNYFLVKSDPDEYGINDLKKDKIATWDGVRNAQAVIFMKQMKVGDKVLVYHSQGQNSIVGLVEVVGNSRPDPTDSKSWLVDFKFIRQFEEPFVTLKQIKEAGKFNKADGFRLTYQSRLSVMPVPDKFINWFKQQSGVKGDWSDISV